MAMDRVGRGTSIYNAIISSGSNIPKLNASEKSQLLATLENIMGDDGGGNGDLIYIKENADILPTALTGPDLNNPAGQAIDVTTGPGAGSTGATSAPETIEGMGSID